MAGMNPAESGNEEPDRTVGLELNQVPADTSEVTAPTSTGGGSRDFASSPAQKAAAAQAIQQHIEPDTRASGGWADEQTAVVVKEFTARDGHGWLTSAALKNAHQSWGGQVTNLMNRLSSEKGALSSTNSLWHRTDVGVGDRVGPPSALDKY
ncbi:hypothetical protein GCM10010331_80130 [Streptomyces xanthochromogenes]|uniref:hypothetical protein n=1 Tax=Streptomyces xanthochromogenes TaxID=67384 RepID=UPI0016743894|nr:hypothetical protein [Streptomyces xanthochromogenes]GHB80625.1 hypothetical protein GCM10010331_80130 [Streptomyces xanthochromogenes]